MISFRRAALCLPILALLALTPYAAHAHPAVDEGIEAANDARFDDALRAFDRAWAATDLTRDELVRMLVQRAIVHAAVRATADLDADLRALATLEPAFTLPQIAPPNVRRRFEAIRMEPRATPAVDVTVGFTSTGTTFAVQVMGIDPALLSRIRVFARAPRGVYVSAEGANAELAVMSQTVEWYAEVLGPGGVRLLTEGEAAAPRHTLNPNAITVAVRDEPEAPSDDRRSRRGLYVGLGSGGAAIVLTAILVAVVRDPAQRTVVEGPVFR
jgi:hypothetical protein